MAVMVPAANPADSKRAGRWFGAVRPAKGGGTRVHNGVDVFAPKGSPVVAPSPAVVERAHSVYTPGFDDYGRVVVLRFPDGARALVAHLEDVFVHAGQDVSEGEVIGTVGDTAFTRAAPTARFVSSDPHTHIERIMGARYPVKSTYPRVSPIAMVFGAPRAVAPVSPVAPVVTDPSPSALSEAPNPKCEAPLGACCCSECSHGLQD